MVKSAKSLQYSHLIAQQYDNLDLFMFHYFIPISIFKQVIVISSYSYNLTKLEVLAVAVAVGQVIQMI